MSECHWEKARSHRAQQAKTGLGVRQKAAERFAGAPNQCPWLQVLVLLLLAAAACSVSSAASLEHADDLLLAGQYTQAHTTLRQLVQRLQAHPEPDAASQRAYLTALRRLSQIDTTCLHQPQRAAAELRALVHAAPASETACTALWAQAHLYQEQLGDRPRAIDAYNQLVSDCRNDPRTPQATLQVLSLRAMNKDAAGVAAASARIGALWPQSDTAAWALFQSAATAFAAGEFEQALSIYTQCADTAERAVSTASKALLRPSGADGDIAAPRFCKTTLAALAQFEIGNCHQELAHPHRALQAYINALPYHPYPALVQNKIARIRSQLYHQVPNGVIDGTRPPPRLLALGRHPAGQRQSLKR